MHTLYHSTISFQFINTCQQQDKNICIITTKKIQGLSPNSTKTHCKSLVDKYINPNERLNDLCLAGFVVDYDIKVNKRHCKSKIIHWVSFNQHKNPEIHYKECSY
jgi:hypothetical protein